MVLFVEAEAFGGKRGTASGCGSIYPVEVKAGKSGSLKSLHQYLLAKSDKIAFRFDLNQPSRQELESSIRLSGTENKTGKVTYSLLSLPLYAVEEMNRICGQIIGEGSLP